MYILCMIYIYIWLYRFFYTTLATLMIIAIVVIVAVMVTLPIMMMKLPSFWRTEDWFQRDRKPCRGTRQSLEIWLFGTRARVRAGLFGFCSIQPSPIRHVRNGQSSHIYCNIINSSSTHQPINSSTHQLINSSSRIIQDHPGASASNPLASSSHCRSSGAEVGPGHSTPRHWWHHGQGRNP